MVQQNMKQLVGYGLVTGLIRKEDIIYTVNCLLDILKLDEFTEEIDETSFDGMSEADFDLEKILKGLLDYAAEHKLMEDDSVVYRDLFDTKIMGQLTARPSEIIAKFRDIYEKQGAVAATEFYYKFSQDTDYIRRYRIKKDVKWVADTQYGALDITINLSKPEKDPKAIAAAKNAKQSGYPKCQLCMENEGYAGRTNHPARENHIIQLLQLQESVVKNLNLILYFVTILRHRSIRLAYIIRMQSYIILRKKTLA